VSKPVATALLLVVAAFLVSAASTACCDDGFACASPCHFACFDGCAKTLVQLAAAGCERPDLPPVAAVADCVTAPISRSVEPEVGPPRA
jgi:hypothetical protein